MEDSMEESLTISTQNAGGKGKATQQSLKVSFSKMKGTANLLEIYQDFIEKRKSQHTVIENFTHMTLKSPSMDNEQKSIGNSLE
jgi:hypothetical protein